MKKIIDIAPTWTCENMDNLSPIDWQGMEVLFDDNSRELIDSYETIKYNEVASRDEIKAFYMRLGYLYIGQEIEIIKGRKLPIDSRKTIKDFIHKAIPGTYGHKDYTYVIFTDGTSCDIKNVRGLEADKGTTPQQFEHPFYIGGRK